MISETIFSLSDFNKKMEYFDTPTFVFDAEKDNDKSVDLKIDKNCKIVLLNLTNEFSFKSIVFPNVDVTISVFSNSALTSMNMDITLGNNSKLVTYFADFVSGDFRMVANVNLNGQESNCVWNLASLSKEEEHKNIDVSVIHNSSNSYSKINNFGVSKDKSKLVFSGICHIKNGSHNSKAHQNAKIMVFDEFCDSIAKPILKIDDNSIEASHAAVVGKISDDQLFYLTSRGLSLEQARELITFGYLKPILAGFDDENIKQIILNKIEEEF